MLGDLIIATPAMVWVFVVMRFALGIAASACNLAEDDNLTGRYPVGEMLTLCLTNS